MQCTEDISNASWLVRCDSTLHNCKVSLHMHNCASLHVGCLHHMAENLHSESLRCTKVLLNKPTIRELTAFRARQQSDCPDWGRTKLTALKVNTGTVTNKGTGTAVGLNCGIRLQCHSRWPLDGQMLMTAMLPKSITCVSAQTLKGISTQKLPVAHPISVIPQAQPPDPPLGRTPSDLNRIHPG